MVGLGPHPALALAAALSSLQPVACALCVVQLCELRSVRLPMRRSLLGRLRVHPQLVVQSPRYALPSILPLTSPHLTSVGATWQVRAGKRRAPASIAESGRPSARRAVLDAETCGPHSLRRCVNLPDLPSICPDLPYIFPCICPYLPCICPEGSAYSMPFAHLRSPSLTFAPCPRTTGAASHHQRNSYT